MKCPYCKDEMIEGFVQSGKQVFFTEKKHKIFFDCGFDEILLTSSNMFCPTTSACCCPTCRMIMIHY